LNIIDRFAAKRGMADFLLSFMLFQPIPDVCRSTFARCPLACPSESRNDWPVPGRTSVRRKLQVSDYLG
jgi:hypothetical protein